MFRKLVKKKKAQNTAEYAILIALVVAFIIAMQTYAQRALQARVRDASKYLVEQTNLLGNSLQYEPYYLDSNFLVTSADNETQRLGKGLTAQETNSATTRNIGGFQGEAYDPAKFTDLVNGL